MHGAPDPLRRGYVLRDLAGVTAAMRLTDEAIEWDREALGILRPTASPVACTTVGWRLGNLLAQRGDWTGAATAFKDAVDAVELSFHGRLETATRRTEIQRAGRLNRWAAFALARSGDPLGAALALENGRARELRRRIGLEQLSRETLVDVPAPLLDALQDSIEALASASMGVQGDDPAYRVPGRGGRDPIDPWQRDVRHRCRGGRPARSGGRIVAACVRQSHAVRDGPDRAAARRSTTRRRDAFPAAQCLGRLPSADLRHRRGGAARSARRRPHPWLLPARYQRRKCDEDFQRNLETPLPWLGEHITRKLRDVLNVVEANGVTLVGCGPVAAAPLHAATWEEAGETRCLLDELVVRYAPSAIVCARARQRAHGRRSPTTRGCGRSTSDLSRPGEPRSTRSPPVSCRTACGSLSVMTPRAFDGAPLRSGHAPALACRRGEPAGGDAPAYDSRTAISPRSRKRRSSPNIPPSKTSSADISDAMTSRVAVPRALIPRRRSHRFRTPTTGRRSSCSVPDIDSGSESRACLSTPAPTRNLP